MKIETRIKKLEGIIKSLKEAKSMLSYISWGGFTENESRALYYHRLIEEILFFDNTKNSPDAIGIENWLNLLKETQRLL